MKFSPAALASHDPAQLEQLGRACHALWMATLSLMTAFMQTSAPAHRLLLARRIARNFETLRDEPCFTHDTRASFGKLSERWHDKVRRLAPVASPTAVPVQAQGAWGWLRRLLPR